MVVQSSAVPAEQYLEGLYDELCHDVARTRQAPQPVSFVFEICIDVDETGGPVFDHGSWPAFLMSLIIPRSRVGMLMCRWAWLLVQVVVGSAGDVLSCMDLCDEQYTTGPAGKLVANETLTLSVSEEPV